MPSTPDYLDPQTLSALAGINLRARMVVEGLMQGMHRSPLQGVSIEFAQHRPYVPGDDTRFLDWKVYGKTDKLYLKQYQKETNLDLILLVDRSGSMSYASQRWRKFDHAACLAAAMGYLAIQQQDRVALSLFDDQPRPATRLSNRQGHWRTLVEALSHDAVADSDAPTDLASMFDALVAKLSHRSLIVMISDLFDDPDALERGLARLHYRRHDLILLQVLDPAELTFPFRSPSRFLGLESEGEMLLDPAALRKGYLQALEQHLQAIEQIARKYRFDYLLVNSAEPLGPPLSHFMARRAAGIAKG